MLNDTDKGIKYFNQLNGNKIIILGNHDTTSKVERYKNELMNTTIIGYSYLFRYKKYNFYLSHYPSICGNLDKDKPLKNQVINLCGHSHTQDPFVDFNKYNSIIFHCELDAHNMYPICLDDIINMIKENL